MSNTTMLGFPLFVILWNKRQGQGTPDHHLRMAEWLAAAWESGDTRLLLMAFRASGKSTIVGLFAAWLLYRVPDLRILVLSADEALARKMVRNVKRLIERHPFTTHLKPDKADQWAGERFTVKRDKELRDPSMLARGISANITGLRADVVICDDVEVPNTCDSAEKREDLRARLAEMSFVLVPGGTQLYIGTPHNYYTIYADQPRHEIGEEAPYLDGFSRFTLPVLDEAGQSAWPTRFGLQDLARMKLAAGPNKFEAQMMLRPVNISEGRLSHDLLHIYDDDLVYQKELQTLWLGKRKIVSASAWWDPAFGARKGDHSVLAVVFADADGHYFIHKVAYIHAENLPDGEDEAGAQCAQIAAIVKALHLPAVAVEINGIGRFLPAILRKALEKARVPCTVLEKTSSRSKELRILEAFDAPLAARRLYVHKDVCATPFLTEMREWQPGRNKGHDDGLDAVAGALSLEPVRVSGTRLPGGPGWARGVVPSKAKTDFDV